jgi:hypothetical protein
MVRLLAAFLLVECGILAGVVLIVAVLRGCA